MYTEAMAAPGGAGNHVLFSNRAAALTAIGTREALSRAVADCTKCSTLRPDFAKAFSRKARALLALGRANDALTAAQEGLRLDPMSAVLRQVHGEAQGGSGGLGAAAKEAWAAGARAALEAAEARDAAARAAEHPLGDRRAEEEEEEALRLLQRELAAVAAAAAGAKRPRKAGEAASDESSGEEEGAGAGEAGGGGGEAERAARALGWEDAEPSAEQVAAAVAEAEAWAGGAAEDHLARLTGPLAVWRCLNPFDVLQLSENAPASLASARFKRLSALVHPDKHPLDEDRARAAFEAVKAAAEAIKDDGKRAWARRLVRQGRRNAARLLRRAHRAGRSALSPLASAAAAGSGGDGAEAEAAAKAARERREVDAKEVLKVFAAAEHRRRTLEESLRKEAQADAMEGDFDRAALKRERGADTAWAGERSGRVDSWRRFQGSGAAGTGVRRDRVSTFGSKAAAEAAEAAGDGTSEFKSTWR